MRSSLGSEELAVDEGPLERWGEPAEPCLTPTTPHQGLPTHKSVSPKLPPPCAPRGVQEKKACSAPPFPPKSPPSPVKGRSTPQGEVL